MLASMEPREFDEWLADHRIEPWGDDWLQTGTTAAVVENFLGAILAAFTGAEPPDRQPTDYYLPKKKHAKRHRRYLTPEESERLDRMRCGV